MVSSVGSARRSVTDSEGRWAELSAHGDHWDVQIDQGSDYINVGLDGGPAKKLERVIRMRKQEQALVQRRTAPLAVRHRASPPPETRSRPTTKSRRATRSRPTTRAAQVLAETLRRLTLAEPVPTAERASPLGESSVAPLSALVAAGDLFYEEAHNGTRLRLVSADLDEKACRATIEAAVAEAAKS
jgi:hypothetical protein